MDYKGQGRGGETREEVKLIQAGGGWFLGTLPFLGCYGATLPRFFLPCCLLLLSLPRGVSPGLYIPGLPRAPLPSSLWSVAGRPLAMLNIRPVSPTACSSLYPDGPQTSET